MTDKYITSSQYERGLDSIKEYIDKSIPYIDPEVIFTLSADKVLEIYNSDNKVMEFDKPSNIDLNNTFIISYNNKDINANIGEDNYGKYISYFNDNIEIYFYPGLDINCNNNENKMIVRILFLNTNISSDIILKQIKTKYLNNKYLKKDVAIKNSITIGSRLLGNNIGKYSFSNGSINTASGDNSHAEGGSTKASGINSHAEGGSTKASGINSHAEGSSTEASGFSSHAEGYWTYALSENQHVQGKFNIEDTSNKYAHIVGNGASDTSRSNAHTLDWDGNAWYAGNVSIEGTPTDDKDLVNKKYVDDNKAISYDDNDFDSLINSLVVKEDNVDLVFLQEPERA